MKPMCKLEYTGGNIFCLMILASQELKKAGLYDNAIRMTERVNTEARTRAEAIAIIMEYVEIEGGKNR